MTRIEEHVAFLARYGVSGEEMARRIRSGTAMPSDEEVERARVALNGLAARLSPVPGTTPAIVTTTRDT